MADDTVDLSSIQSALDEQDGGWEAGATPLLDMSPEKRRNTNLIAADLSRSDLTEARLDGANLRGTNLSGAWGIDPGSLADA
ncbi:MAG: pentapeptide repeat-containing protein, partial [Mycetocola sp.]